MNKWQRSAAWLFIGSMTCTVTGAFIASTITGLLTLSVVLLALGYAALELHKDEQKKGSQ